MMKKFEIVDQAQKKLEILSVESLEYAGIIKLINEILTTFDPDYDKIKEWEKTLKSIKAPEKTYLEMYKKLRGWKYNEGLDMADSRVSKAVMEWEEKLSKYMWPVNKDFRIQLDIFYIVHWMRELEMVIAHNPYTKTKLEDLWVTGHAKKAILQLYDIDNYGGEEYYRFRYTMETLNDIESSCKSGCESYSKEKSLENWEWHLNYHAEKFCLNENQKAQLKAENPEPPIMK